MTDKTILIFEDIRLEVMSYIFMIDQTIAKTGQSRWLLLVRPIFYCSKTLKQSPESATNTNPAHTFVILTVYTYTHYIAVASVVKGVTGSVIRKRISHCGKFLNKKKRLHYFRSTNCLNDIFMDKCYVIA